MSSHRLLPPSFTTVSLLSVTLFVTACANRPNQISTGLAVSPGATTAAPAAPVPPGFANAAPATPATAPLQSPTAPKLPSAAAPVAPAAAPAETLLWPVNEEPMGADGRFRRVSTVRRPGSKYPLIRCEQVMRRTATGETQISSREMVADHLTVTMVDGGLSRLAGLLPTGYAIREVIPELSTAIVSIPAGSSQDFTIARSTLQLIPGAAAVDADHVAHQMSTIPNDPYANQLDAELRNLELPQAWDVTTGNRSVKVAVIDTGVDITHPDLVDNIWTNQIESGGRTGADDDHNGFNDDLHGWNFYDNTNDVTDQNGHGTSVAGLIGAMGDNGIGVAGIAWGVSLVPLKVLNADGGSHGTIEGFESDMAKAINYAVSINCRVVNLSIGHSGSTGAMLDQAIARAGSNNVLCVCAAGNDGVDNDANPNAPSTSSRENVIAVAAMNTFSGENKIDDLSNYGRETVDIAAPGLVLATTIPHDSYGLFTGEQGYDLFSGTSAAAPLVSGALALLLSQQPSLSASAAKERLFAACDQPYSALGKIAEARSLNVGALLNPVLPKKILLTSVDRDRHFLRKGQSVTFNLSIFNQTVKPSGSSIVQVSFDPIFVEIPGVPRGARPGQSEIAVPALAPGETRVVPVTVRAISGSSSPITSSVDLRLMTKQGVQPDPVTLSLRIFDLGTGPTPSVALPFVVGDSVASPRLGGAYIVNSAAPALLRLGGDDRRLVQSSTPITATSEGFDAAQIAVSPGETAVYIANSAQHAIHRFSLPDMAERRWSLTFAPASIVAAGDGSIYVTRDGNVNELHRLDGVTGIELSLTQVPDQAFANQNQSGSAGLTLKTDEAGNRLWAFQKRYIQSDFDGNQALRIFQLTSTGPVFDHEEYYFSYSGLSFAPVSQLDSSFVISVLRSGGTNLSLTSPEMLNGATNVARCPWAISGSFNSGSPTVRGEDGKVLVVGVMQADSYIPMVAVFDPAANSWVPRETVFFEDQYNQDTGYTQRAGIALKSSRTMLIAELDIDADGNYQPVTSRIAIAGPDMIGAPRNNLPMARGSVVAPTVGHTATFDLTGSADPDGGRLSWRWEFGDGMSTGGSLAAGTTPAPISHTYVGGSTANGGKVTARLLVTDGEGLTDAVQIPVAIDQAPTLTSTAVSVPANRSVTVSLVGQDADGDTLTYRVTATGATVSARIAGSTLIVTPQANWIGSTTVTVVAFDGFMDSEPATITVTVVGSGLPVPWTAVDTTRARAGKTTYDWNTGVYRIRGSGDGSPVADPGISGLAATMPGDGTLTAKVLPWPVAGMRRPTDAGLLIREYALADSRMVMIGLGADGQAFWAVRSQHGGPVERTVIAGVAGNPRWLRLKREGNDLTGQVSVDGSVWFAAGRTTLPFVTASELCLVQTTGAGATVAATEFANVALRLVQPTPVAFPLRVNFQPVSAPPVPDYRIDDGAQYGVRTGGTSYGWQFAGPAAADRNSPLSTAQHPADAQLYDTLVAPSTNNVWSAALPNGRYTVRVVAGDPTLDAGSMRIAANGVAVVSGQLSKAVRWLDGSATVTVSDGRLRMISAAGGTLFRPAFLVITPVPAPPLPTGGG